MSVTYGFYNSVPDPETGVGDRRYTAEQFSSIFDGIISDGIYSQYGAAFVVKASDDQTYLTVGTGRAWFNHTWTLNDTTMVLYPDMSHDTLNRYDAVVIEINTNESYRQNSIKIVQGTPATTPSYPVMENTSTLHQYPLAYIYRPYSDSKITTANITNARGTEACPFVTGIVQQLSIDDLLQQWHALFETWTDAQKDYFTAWFANVQGIFTGDAAGNIVAMVTKTNHVTEVTLPASAWYQDGNVYTQSVEVEGLSAVDEPILVSALPTTATLDQQKAYMKAFGIVAQGYAQTANGVAVFSCYKRPEIDIRVGLKGV